MHITADTNQTAKRPVKNNTDQFIKGSDIDAKIWKQIKWIFISILLALLIGVIVFEQSKGNCSNYYEFINQKYKGKVVAKYFNRADHMNATIKLDDENLYVINPFDTTAYFDSIEIGDVVIKNSNSLKYYVVKSFDTLLFEILEPECKKYLKNDHIYNTN